MSEVKSFSSVSGKVVFGFDGIVDEVWEVVEERYDIDNYKVVEKMADYGRLITERGTGGLSKERVLKRRVCGGFCGNTGRAAGRLLSETTLVGRYGAPVLHPNFAELTENCKLISISDPAQCFILEFTDGKIMMTNTQVLRGLTWDVLAKSVTLPVLDEILGGASVLCLGYWCDMPYFDDVIETVSKRYPGKPFFFDFGNVTKRGKDAMKTTLLKLSAIKNRTTLSMNEHEGAYLLSAYGITPGEGAEGLAEAAKKARELTGLDELVIHDPRYAVMSSAEETVAVPQIFVEKPVKTAGAGDTFNAGYVFASLGDFDGGARLNIANSASRFYLKNGFPPDREQLLKEINPVSPLPSAETFN